MNDVDWQLVATIACIGLAGLFVVRQMIGLFSSDSPSACQSGGCSACPSNKTGQGEPAPSGFVSLQTLIQSTHPLETSNEHNPTTVPRTEQVTHR